jgi:hypothetical protein
LVRIPVIFWFVRTAAGLVVGAGTLSHLRQDAADKLRGYGLGPASGMCHRWGALLRVPQTSSPKQTGPDDSGSAIGTGAQKPQQTAVEPVAHPGHGEVQAQQLGDGEDILAVRDWRQDLRFQPTGKQRDALGVARWTEIYVFWGSLNAKGLRGNNLARTAYGWSVWAVYADVCIMPLCRLDRELFLG